jgi:proline iminopeptidase
LGGLYAQFVLHGTSWGSTLALAYALANPGRVGALVIGGVFTGSKVETDWIDSGMFKTFYPDAWQRYLDATPQEHRVDPSAYHHHQAIHGSAEQQKASAFAYGSMESSVARLDDRFTTDDFALYDPAGSRIEMHYLQNLCFMPDQYLLDNLHRLSIPIHIVQGRYDMVCPPTTAYEVSQKAPHVTLYWTLGGHAVEHESENIFRAIFASL